MMATCEVVVDDLEWTPPVYTPESIAEPITLEPHNPAYAEFFEDEKATLLTVLPSRGVVVEAVEVEGEEERRLVTRKMVRRGPFVEHIGSTAVQGLLAKPVVDIMVGYSYYDHDDAGTSGGGGGDATTTILPVGSQQQQKRHLFILLHDALRTLGYEYMGLAPSPSSTLPNPLNARHYFRKRPTTTRHYNIHIVWSDSPIWTSNLCLRDFLRADPDARVRYANAKRAAVREGDVDLHAYSESKKGVVGELVEDAIQWAGKAKR
ncbi:hypothetical protein DFJ77DRAFT_469938 [Powellomyces hirtus]|nr:hypothetical protein DFJ77DRAFT_469938 [Powellomyces hirtus]